MKKQLLAFVCFIGVFISACSSVQTETVCEKSKPVRKIAVQSWTCNTYTVEEMCILFNSLGVDKIELHMGQKLGGCFPNIRTNPNMKKEHFDYMVSLFDKYGIKVIATGVHYVKSEASVIDICNFAKKLGVEFITTECTPEMIKVWRKHIGDIKLAVHNHDKMPFADFNYVAKLIAPYENVGACADNGGWTRAGLDSVEGMKALKGKLFMLHFKDQEKLGDNKSNAKIYGTGCVDLKAVLAELDKQGFDGYFVIEHGNYDDKFQVIKRDIDFLKNN